MKKVNILAFILIITLVGTVSATLESSVFGFGKDMAMSQIGSANPALGQAISFAMCPQCAVTGSAMGALDEVIPGASKAYGFVNDPQGALLAEAKSSVIKELKKEMSPEEKMMLDNIQNIQPYVEEAFEVNPEAPEGEQMGKVEIDENGNTIIKNGKGEVFSKIPKNYEVVEEEGSFTLINRGETSEETLEIKGNKFNLEKGAKISFSEKDGISSFNLEGSGNININGTTLNNVQNASIRLDENNQIEFAEFTSTKQEMYDFVFNNEKYNFFARENSTVVFDPKNGRITGENVRLDFGGEIFDGSKIDLSLEDGNLKEVKISAGGYYLDKENDMEYSSKEDFKVYFDGTDVSSEKNALSVLKEGDNVQVNSKGKIKIENENGLTYEGLNEEAYVRYREWDNVFDVKAGNAVIDNGVHEIKLEDGKTLLSTDNLMKDTNAESFSFKYGNDPNSEDVSYTKINEISGNIEVISFVDGKEKATILYPFEKFQERKEEFPQGNPVEKVQREIDKLNEEIFLLKEQGEGVSDLSEKRDALGLLLVNHDVKESLESGDYDYAIKEFQMQVNNLGDGEVKDTAMLSLAEVYQAKANQLVGTDPEMAYDYYAKSKQLYMNNGLLAESPEERGMILGSLHNTLGEYDMAEKEYSMLMNSEDKDIRNRAHMGLASTLLMDGEPGAALRTIGTALENDPDNEVVANAKKDLELAILDTINSAIDTDGAEITKLYRQEIGADRSWYNKNLLYENLDVVTDYYGTVADISGSQLKKLDLQQKGVVAIRQLRDSGYSFDEIYENFGEVGKSNDERRNLIIKTFGLPVDSTDGKEAGDAHRISTNILLSIDRAFENDDIVNLAAGGKSRKFNFETGEGYVDKSFYDKDLYDSIIMEQFTPVNLAMWTVPVVPIKGASLIGWAGKGIGKVAGVSAAGTRTTIGATKLGKYLSKEVGFANNKLVNGVMRFTASEGVETGVGTVADVVVPGSGQFVEILTGHSQLSELSSKAVRRAIDAPATGKIFQVDGGASIQGLEFSSQKHLNEFLQGSTATRIADNLYESNGVRFVPIIKNSGPKLDPIKSYEDDLADVVIPSDFPTYQKNPEKFSKTLEEMGGANKIEDDLQILGWERRVLSNDPDLGMYIVQNKIKVSETGYAFHGTSTKFLDSIKKKGLNIMEGPEMNPGVIGRTIDGATYTGNIGMSRSFSKSSASNTGGEGVIFRWEKEGIQKTDVSITASPVPPKDLEYSLDDGVTWNQLADTENPSMIGGKEVVGSGDIRDMQFLESLKLEGREMNNPSEVYFTMVPAEKKVWDKRVEIYAKKQDRTLDEAYHYGRSSSGFGYEANKGSAGQVLKLLDNGVHDIEKLSEAAHEGWGKVAKTYNDPVYKTKPEKETARHKLADTSYSDLPELEKEKDRVVARSLLDLWQKEKKN